MKQIFNIITYEEASELSQWEVNRSSSDFSNSIINKVSNKYMEILNRDLLLEHPSYWLVEREPNGHVWHYDPDTDYGSSVLISNPKDFKGGNLWLKDGDTSEKVENHYLSGCIYQGGKHNNPVTHMVTANTGERKVLLMFFN